MIMNNEEVVLQEAMEILAQRDGVTVTAPMMIHSYLSAIMNDIANRLSNKEIVLKYNLQIKPESLSTVFKQATNTSISDVPKKTTLEINLAKKGYTADKIAEIMECV